MESIAIVSLVDACINLAFKCAGAIKKMHDITSRYKSSKLILMSITQYLDTMQYAWERIGEWTKSYTPNTNVEDDGCVFRMARILETGKFVMEALEEDLVKFSNESMAFGQRAKLIWNENTFLDHQSRISHQATSMTLLLQAIQLPTPKDRGRLILKSEKQFKISDESAYSIVPSRMSSRMSISTRGTDARGSFRSEEDIVYHRLSFEDDLFTARVYKRNYRNRMLLRLWRSKPQLESGTFTPVGVVQQTNTALPRADSFIGQNQENVPVKSVQNVKLLSKLSKIKLTRLTNAELNRKFIIACEQGDCSTVHAFLRMGHDVLSEQTYPGSGFGAIYAAVKYGQIEVVQILLQRGASIEGGGTTVDSRPLHLAAQLGNIVMVQFLLANGAQLKAENKEGLQPIHLAAKSGKIGTLRTLLDQGATLDCFDKAGRQPLHWAAESSDWPEVIGFLVSAGSQINVWTRANNIEIHHERPLNMACRRNLPGNVGALLTLGADTTGATNRISYQLRVECSLRKVIYYQSFAAMNALLQHGAKAPNWLGPSETTPLHLYVKFPPRKKLLDDLGLFLLVLRHQDNINAQDAMGDTGLHCFCRKWRKDGLCLVKILLKMGADFDVFNKEGHTPLYVATKFRNRGLVMVLIQAGARRLIKMDGHTLYLNVQGSIAICGDGKYDTGRKRIFELYWYPVEPHHDNAKEQVLQDLIYKTRAFFCAAAAMPGITDKSPEFPGLKIEISTQPSTAPFQPLIPADAAEMVLACIFQNLDSLQDLIAFAMVSRWVYNTFRRHKSFLRTNVLPIPSPIYWRTCTAGANEKESLEAHVGGSMKPTECPNGIELVHLADKSRVSDLAGESLGEAEDDVGREDVGFTEQSIDRASVDSLRSFAPTIVSHAPVILEPRVYQSKPCLIEFRQTSLTPAMLLTRSRSRESLSGLDQLIPSSSEL